MIPDIGWMIGLYIVTNMMSVLLKPKDEASSVTRMLAGGTIAFCLFAMYDLSQQGAKVDALLK